MNDNEIRLTLPALPEYVRLARLTVAALATRVGFTYDEVEDLRIAVGEACTLVTVDPATGLTGAIAIVFRLEADELSVDVANPAVAGVLATRPDSAELSEQILASVIDEYRFNPADATVWLSKRLAPG